MDTTGKSSTDNVTISVGPPNSSPTCSITTPQQNTTGVQGALVSFSALANDVDVAEDTLSAVWSSDKDGVLGTSLVNSDGSISFPFMGLTTDTHVISLIVTDEVGATCTTSVNYTVGTPPSIAIHSPADGSVYTEGESIGFIADIADGQDLPNEVDLVWTVNGDAI